MADFEDTCVCGHARDDHKNQHGACLACEEGSEHQCISFELADEEEEKSDER